MPGIAASTSETWLLGSPPNSVEAPENSFEFEVSWAWTSMPITTSQSPVWPLISFELVALMVDPQAARRPSAPIRSPEDRSRAVCRPGGTSSRRYRDRLRHDGDKHGPRLNQYPLHPGRFCAPGAIRPCRPTTERPRARRDLARALRP